MLLPITLYTRLLLLKVCATIWLSVVQIGLNWYAWRHFEMAAWSVNMSYIGCPRYYSHCILHKSHINWRHHNVFLKQQRQTRMVCLVDEAAVFLLLSKCVCARRWALRLQYNASEFDFGLHPWTRMAEFGFGAYSWLVAHFSAKGMQTTVKITFQR